MLKKLLMITSLGFISMNTFAYDAKSCQIKKEKLTQQLQYAKKYNNTHRIQGIEQALARVNQQCAQFRKHPGK